MLWFSGGTGAPLPAQAETSRQTANAKASVLVLLPAIRFTFLSALVIPQLYPKGKRNCNGKAVEKAAWGKNLHLTPPFPPGNRVY